MDKGILNITLLEKDIQQIKFYSSEENKKLNKICTKFEECCNNYRSENMSILMNDINKFKIDINNLSEKRKKYLDVLTKVILQYNELREDTKRFFDKDV